MSMNFGAGYSADVALSLETGGLRHELSHAGSDYVRLRSPAQLPAGPAELIVSVDGRETRRIVNLVCAISPPERKVRYEAFDQAAVSPGAVGA